MYNAILTNCFKNQISRKIQAKILKNPPNKTIFKVISAFFCELFTFWQFNLKNFSRTWKQALLEIFITKNFNGIYTAKKSERNNFSFGERFWDSAQQKVLNENGIWGDTLTMEQKIQNEVREMNFVCSKFIKASWELIHQTKLFWP